MKEKILERLSRLHEYISKASTDELVKRYSECGIDSEVAKSYARVETEVLTCYVQVEFQLPTSSKSFGNDQLDDFAMAA